MRDDSGTAANGRGTRRQNAAQRVRTEASATANGTHVLGATTPNPPQHEPVTALSEHALHITVYELLAHAYNRVGIQHYHDSGAALLSELQLAPMSSPAPTLSPTLQREVVAALFADAARALATFFGFEEMNFLLLDHERQVYRLIVREGPFFPNFQPGSYEQPFGTGILGQCHLERRTILLHDVSQSPVYVRTDPTVRAEMCVPVVLGDDVLALIDTGASRMNALSGRQAEFIEGFARYLAPAITDPLAFLGAWRPGPVSGDLTHMSLAQSLNFLYAWHTEWRSRFAELYLEVAQRNAELLALTDLGESLSSTLRLDAILATTVAKVAHLLSCEMSWILLPDADGRLRIRALHGGSAGEHTGAGIAPDDSPQFAVYSRGEPLITNVGDGTLPRSSFDWTFCARYGISRFLTVPLRTRERTIGVMNVGRTASEEGFDERDARLLSTFANTIALYIENADLYEQSRHLGALEERNRLARDLHDTLVQSLVGILRTLEQARTAPDSISPALQSSLASARALAVQSLDEARRSVWNLRPAELRHKELREALRDWLELWSQRTGIAARFHSSGAPLPIVPDVEASVLRVGQEALGNVARHASATHVDVTLEFAAASLRMTVADDGVGFDPATLDAPAPAAGGRKRRRRAAHAAQSTDAASLDVPTRSEPSPAGGFGLRGMRERAKLMGGWLQVESAPGWGTRIVLTVSAFAAPEHTGGVTSPLSPAGGRGIAPGTGALAEQRADQEVTSPAGTNGHPITLLLADDHPSVRDGLRLAFAGAPGFEVLGAAESSREAVELARTLRPDVLLLDMHLPDGDGLTVLRQVREAGLRTRVVMLTAHLDDAHIAGALQGGAAGYLEKEIETGRLLAAVRTAVSGRLALSPAVAARLQQREGLLVNLAAGRLTRREREVLDSLAAGLGYREIAARMSISVATVKFHTIHLYQKLHASRRVEALNRAREWGLLG